MKTEDRIGALVSSAVFDSYNSALRKIFSEVYNEKTLIWKTADYNVCDVCKKMDEIELNIEDTIGLLPVHPYCMCTWIKR